MDATVRFQIGQIFLIYCTNIPVLRAATVSHLLISFQQDSAYQYHSNQGGTGQRVFADRATSDTQAIVRDDTQKARCHNGCYES